MSQGAVAGRGQAGLDQEGTSSSRVVRGARPGGQAIGLARAKDGGDIGGMEAQRTRATLSVG